MKNVKLLLVDGFLINSLMIYFHLIISYQARSIILTNVRLDNMEAQEDIKIFENKKNVQRTVRLGWSTNLSKR